MPFQALYNRSPHTPPGYIPGSANSSVVDQFMLDRDALLAQHNLLKAQHCMKVQADKHRYDLQFQIGLGLCQAPTIPIKFHPSSSPPQTQSSISPFKVINRIDEFAYKLDLPDTAKIHPVFHISLFRKCTGVPEQEVTPLHPVDSANTLILQPIKVLAHCVIERYGHQINQLLIQWMAFHQKQ